MKKPKVIKIISLIGFVISSLFVIWPPGGIKWLPYVFVVTGGISLHFLIGKGEGVSRKRAIIVLCMAILIAWIIFYFT